MKNHRHKLLSIIAILISIMNLGVVLLVNNTLEKKRDQMFDATKDALNTANELREVADGYKKAYEQCNGTYKEDTVVIEDAIVHWGGYIPDSCFCKHAVNVCDKSITCLKCYDDGN